MDHLPLERKDAAEMAIEHEDPARQDPGVIDEAVRDTDREIAPPVQVEVAGSERSAEALAGEEAVPESG